MTGHEIDLLKEYMEDLVEQARHRSPGLPALSLQCDGAGNLSPTQPTVQ